MPEAGQLSTLPFVDPQLAGTGWNYRPVPASDPRPLPVADRPLTLDIDVVGAGRTMSLAEFHAATVSTSLLVLVDGVLRHEWYRDGLGPGTRFLGASATKSVLCHLVGGAVRTGALGLDDLVEQHVPELAGTGYAGVPVRHLLSMTSGVDWVEDRPPGPVRARQRAGRGVPDRSVLAGGPGPGRPAVRAGHPLRVLHGRLPGA